jgi:hypothetical protein
LVQRDLGGLGYAHSFQRGYGVAPAGEPGRTDDNRPYSYAESSRPVTAL